jgi:hypothetical protein
VATNQKNLTDPLYAGVTGVDAQDLFTGTASTYISNSSVNGLYYSNITTSAPSVDINRQGITMLPEADLKIGDTSLKEFMKSVSERLNILQPNPALEKEWQQLKELGDAYRALEADLLEKAKMWGHLSEK